MNLELISYPCFSKKFLDNMEEAFMKCHLVAGLWLFVEVCLSYPSTMV